MDLESFILFGYIKDEPDWTSIALIASCLFSLIYGIYCFIKKRPVATTILLGSSLIIFVLAWMRIMAAYSLGS